MGDRATYAFPVLEDGCVDADFGWEAPAKVGAGGGRRVVGELWDFAWWWGLMVGVCGVLIA